MLRYLDVGQVLFFLQTVQETPDSGVRAAHERVKSVMPPLSDVGGSGEQKLSIIMVVPL